MAPNRVALFRSVNVAGHAALSMAKLRDEAEALGLAEPMTLLQSGNLLFRSEMEPAVLEADLEAMLVQRFGLVTTIMVRTHEQWRTVVEGNPFPAEAVDDPSHLVVCALKHEARPGAADAITAAIRGRERVRMGEGCLFAVYPDGIGRSKLTVQVLERHLGTPCTGRNWNTGLKIATALKG